jgi:hypothetical protein
MWFQYGATSRETERGRPRTSVAVSSSSRTGETVASNDADLEKGTGKRPNRESRRDKEGDEDYRYPVTEVDDARLGIPEGETSPHEDEVMNEIIREVDEGGRRRRTHSGDEDGGEYDGAQRTDHDLEDEMQSKHKRRTRFTHRISTAPGATAPTGPPLTWWSRFKHFVFPPSPDLESIIPNYRLTPIISGILIPFSILLEIPGLTEEWYIRTESHKIVETKPNSVILNVGLGISIGSGLAANFFLILRFLEKRVKTMTIVSIAFLTFHGACFVCYISVGCHSGPDADRHRHPQT